jgi:hypothetical protein
MSGSGLVSANLGALAHGTGLYHIHRHQAELASSRHPGNTEGLDLRLFLRDAAMADRRRHIRIGTKIAVRCRIEGIESFDALATDMGLGGTRLEGATVPEYGTQMTIVAHLPGSSEVSRLPATVRWTGSNLFGVQFGLLGAHDTRIIAEMMGQSIRLKSGRPG